LGKNIERLDFYGSKTNNYFKNLPIQIRPLEWERIDEVVIKGKCRRNAVGKIGPFSINLNLMP